MNVQYRAFVDWTVYRYKRGGEALVSLDPQKCALNSTNLHNTRKHSEQFPLGLIAQGKHLTYKLRDRLAGISVASDDP